MKWDDLSDDWCPVARTLGVIGDRWTILIVRDCVLGISRFEGFQKSLGITRHVLADRLKRLVDADVLTKQPYQTGPVRYDYLLTDRGKDLSDVLSALRDWGREHVPLRRPCATATDHELACRTETEKVVIRTAQDQD
ncbi:MAG: transcriptional regulator [Hirschia sp.]|nr:transcriptional regulator [Hirschia sp.]MBF18854.1 transcriptional regulator [Hirschia sp.]|tara:strand:+ start:86 stop:496 length:411 start_codon:yes stop_codon:yes gene_type:complete